jgi:hypothetical protein
MPSIGFVILSHNQPKMLKRLVGRLNRAFGHPPIACHHDLHQLQIDFQDFPKNIEFVKDPVRTRWGEISTVEALLLGLRTLYSHNEPDWFVTLSPSDYPVKSADTILRDLAASHFDAYLNHRLINWESRTNFKRDQDFEQGFDRPFWTDIAYDRYLARIIRYPGFNRKGEPCLRRWRLRHPSLASSSPFDSTFRCYGGDTWFTARNTCAHVLLADDAKSRELFKYYRGRENADESYYQTILCNTAGLKICNDNKRYSNWNSGGPHPKLLGLEDVPALIDSPSHFARKFAESSESALDELDRRL